VTEPRFDKYGEVVNEPETFDALASHLLAEGRLLIGWTDGEFTHLDLVFALHPLKFGNIQRRLHHSRQLLFVSVIGFTAFGFDTFDRNGPLYPSYVGEKLGIGDNATAAALTELINELLERVGKF
jgi:hypothetical protein